MVSQILILLIFLFFTEVLLLILAGWIYNLLNKNGVFGTDPRVIRAAAFVFILLPVLCGLVLIPGVVLQLSPAGPVFDPGGVNLPILGSTDPVGKIVYTCQVFGDMNRDQICLMDADGSNQVRLTQNDSGDYNYPSLAPDGDSLVYSGNDTGEYEIYEMDLDGNVTRLTEGLSNAIAPAISPDGRRIVFARRTEDDQSIWVMDRDGSDPQPIFGPPSGDGWDPVWSPDGRQILFASNMSGGIQLFRMNPDGSDVQQVSRLTGIRGRNDWSPDGTTIATYAGESWEREIFFMDPDGTSLRQVTDGGNNLAPSFSPDGGWITFTSYRDNFRNENGCEIYIMRLEDREVFRLTENSYCDWQPRWGP